MGDGNIIKDIQERNGGADVPKVRTETDLKMQTSVDRYAADGIAEKNAAHKEWLSRLGATN